jgi:hypothetical protein
VTTNRAIDTTHTPTPRCARCLATGANDLLNSHTTAGTAVMSR